MGLTFSLHNKWLRKQHPLCHINKKLGISLPREEYVYFAPQLHFFYCKTLKSACTKTSMILFEFLLTGFQERGVIPSNRRLLDSIEDKNGLVHEAKKSCVPNISAYPQDYAIKALKDPTLFKFAFVRNPYMRLISGYEGKILPQKTGIHNSVYRDLIWNAQAMDGKELSFSFYNYNPPSFEAFARYICSLPTHKMDDHFVPQHFQLRPERFPYDFIGKLENYEEDMRYVLEKLQQLNNITFPASVYEKLRERTDNSTVQDQKSPKEYYSESLRKLVYERFQKDFELFGYSQDLP